MDYNIFKEIPSKNFDVIVFYQYENLFLNESISSSIKKYNEVNLISWSMGTWVSAIVLKDITDKLNVKIAINGTLKPVNDNFGIPTKVYQSTIDFFGPIGRVKFFKRMWNNIEIPEIFKKHKSSRLLEDQKKELIYLRDNSLSLPEPKNIFDTLIISQDDRITPSSNQMNYWNDKVDIIKLDAPHFPFYLWENWDDILSYGKK